MALRMMRPRMADISAFGAAAVVSVSLLALPVHAQKKPAKAPDEAAEKAAEADAARKAYGAGLSAYQAGKYENAAQSLSAALRGGGLAGPEMAKALYTRGLAYRRSGKNAQAISDLTSAIWLKNGLSESEKSEAIAARSEAYREAGISEAAVTVASGAPNASVAPGAPKQAAPAAAPSSSGSFFSRLFTPSAPPSTSISDNVAARQAPAPVPMSTADAAVPAPIPATGPAPAAGFGEMSVTTASAANSDAYRPASGFTGSDSAAAVAPAPASNGGIGGFFSNMFSGSARQQQAAAPTETASSNFTTSSTTPQVATSSWVSTTEVRSAASAPARERRSSGVQTASIDSQTAYAAAPPAPVLKGKYKMHIAAVRSRQEADDIAARLLAQHAGVLESRRPVVDEAVIGSMGTFYRVRIAPYRTAEEARQTCKSLKSGGFDCLVVTK